MTQLLVRAAGPGVTVQDGGRPGWLRFGVTAAGPMDPLAFATANRALGNPEGWAALEVSLGGLELAVDGGPVRLAVAGGVFDLSLDGRPLPPAARLTLEPGALLRIRAGAAGAWCYVAMAARLQLPAVLGSLATHTRSGMGGLGRGLAAGDALPLADLRAAGGPVEALEAPWLDRPGAVIRVLPGPQDDYFGPDHMAAFLAGPWTVSGRSDRMAYLLSGPRLGHAKGFNIVSDGIAMGAIQVPGDGQPIVLMADRQPTGGYPKIAAVIGADLGRLAQLRPGAELRFQAVTHAQAVAARRAEHDALAAGVPGRTLVRTDFSSDYLLGLNLVDGVVSGD